MTDTIHTRAAVLPEPRGAIEIRELSLPMPHTGEALLRMEACGVCHSDLFVASLEKLPLTPLTIGHEGIARIEQIGPAVTGFAVGDRVGITFLASSCGACDLCRSGRERFCSHQLNFGYTVHGAMSEYAVVPVPYLVRIPDSLTAAEAAPLCCAGWTAWGALREAGLRDGQTVGMFGLGGLGHLAVQYAHARGLHVAAVDVSEKKLELARSLGAEFTASGEDAGKSLQRQGGLDAAIVMTANTAAIQQAFRALKPGGTLVLVGLATAEFTLPLVNTILKGITVKGSYLGTRQDLEEVFRASVRPHVQTHEIDAVPGVLAKMKRGELLGRAVVTFD